MLNVKHISFSNLPSHIISNQTVNNHILITGLTLIYYKVAVLFSKELQTKSTYEVTF